MQKNNGVERDRQWRWDAGHMATCSCRLRREDYEAFRRVCARRGKTAHEALRHMVGRILLDCGEKISPGLERDMREAYR